MKKTTKTTVDENGEKVFPQGECADAACDDEDDKEFVICINPLFD